MTAKINVFGVDYSIRFKKMGKHLYGDCDTDKKIIRINDRKEDFASTLVHEVIHAALAESGIHHMLVADGMEEALVRAIEHGLKTAELIPEVSINDFMDPIGGGDDATGNGLDSNQ